MEEEYLDFYCDCLSQDSGQTPLVVLYKANAECFNLFQHEHEELIRLVLNQEYPDDTAMSMQEKFDDAGKKMIQNTIVTIIRECDFYRTSLKKYKEELMRQVGVDKDNAMQGIKEMKEGLHKISDEFTLSTAYAIVAVMYEYLDDDENALLYYDKSLSTHEMTATKGLRELFLLEE